MNMRPLRQDDAEFLCLIFKDNVEYYEIFFDSANTLSEWENRVEHFRSQNVVNHFIIEANDKKAGWLSFADTDSAERELCILVISKEHLRCKYGTQSLSWLIEKSKADNMRSLLLNVNQNNTRAIQFYKNFGFDIIGEEIVPECNEAVNLAQYKMRLHLV